LVYGIEGKVPLADLKFQDKDHRPDEQDYVDPAPHPGYGVFEID
jgi:hypothetical protein